MRLVLPFLAALALAPLGATGPASAAEVTGTVTYRDRAMLPPDVTLTVTLADISRADAPAKVIATFEQEGIGAPPYPFSLSYDPAQIDERFSYSVSARVTVEDRLLMTTDTVAPVLTRGAGSQVDLVMIRVTGQAAEDRLQDQVLTAPGLRLPATFTGTIPMASGPGAEWHLDLWPDQVFHLTQGMGDGAQSADIGRWSADPERNAIRLDGGREAPIWLEIRGNGNLRLMDREGRPIDSDLPYDLVAGPLAPAEPALPMQGAIRYLADAMTFEECLTGRTYPVAMEGAYIDVERAYTASDEVQGGEPIIAVLEGALAMRPAMEGPDRPHLVVERFSRLAPGQTCERSRSTASLTNTYWRILAISGEALAPLPDTREPHLILRGGAQPGYSASVGCNQMRGGFDLTGQALSFGAGATTMMACPPPLDGYERALALALSDVADWRINGETLELRDANGTVLILAESVYLP
jgi:copper homeostasis protein (lipoprotein)